MRRAYSRWVRPRAPSAFARAIRQTDGRTDGQTDRRTDGQIDADRPFGVAGWKVIKPVLNKNTQAKISINSVRFVRPCQQQGTAWSHLWIEVIGLL